MDGFHRRWPLVALIGLGASSALAMIAFDVSPEDILAKSKQLAPWVAAHPMLGAAAFVLAVAISVASAMPGSMLLDLVGGGLFGAAAAMPLALAGEVLGAAVLYFASRRALGLGYVAPGRGPAALAGPMLVAERMRAGYQRRPWRYTLTACAVPMMPTGVLVIALVLLGCPPLIFLVSTAVGEGLMLGPVTRVGSGVAYVARHGWTLTSVSQAGMGTPLAILVILLSFPWLAKYAAQWCHERTGV